MKMNESVFSLPAGFTVTAHAGAMNTAANTLESLKVGLQNADIAEVDVSHAADGTPVLYHGFTPPADATLLEDALQVLASFPDKWMNLDLKVFDHLPAVQEIAKRCGVLDRVFFTGVGKRHAEDARTGAPKIPYYLNVSILPLLKNNKAYAHHLVHLAQRCGAVGLNSNHMNATQTIVDAFHENSLLVSLWTVRNEKDMQKVLRLAPDNMTTVMPDRANLMLKEGETDND